MDITFLYWLRLSLKRIKECSFQTIILYTWNKAMAFHISCLLTCFLYEIWCRLWASFKEHFNVPLKKKNILMWEEFSPLLWLVGDSKRGGKNRKREREDKKMAFFLIKRSETQVCSPNTNWVWGWQAFCLNWEIPPS